MWQAIQDRSPIGVNLKKQSEKEINFFVCVGLGKQLRIGRKLGLIRKKESEKEIEFFFVCVGLRKQHIIFFNCHTARTIGIVLRRLQDGTWSQIVCMMFFYCDVELVEHQKQKQELRRSFPRSSHEVFPKFLSSLQKLWLLLDGDVKSVDDKIKTRRSRPEELVALVDFWWLNERLEVEGML